MRISDLSADVCSSDLGTGSHGIFARGQSTAGGGAEAGTNREPFEVALEDHVAYSRNRIGTVDRRRTVGNNLDSFHCLHGNCAAVYRLRTTAVGHTPLMENGKSGYRTQAAYVLPTPTPRFIADTPH